jgi:hypothetical protein
VNDYPGDERCAGERSLLVITQISASDNGSRRYAAEEGREGEKIWVMTMQPIVKHI